MPMRARLKTPTVGRRSTLEIRCRPICSLEAAVTIWLTVICCVCGSRASPCARRNTVRLIAWIATLPERPGLEETSTSPRPTARQHFKDLRNAPAAPGSESNEKRGGMPDSTQRSRRRHCARPVSADRSAPCRYFRSAPLGGDRPLLLHLQQHRLTPLRVRSHFRLTGRGHVTAEMANIGGIGLS